MTAEELRTSLLSAPKNGYTALTAEQRQENAQCFFQQNTASFS